MRMFLRRGTIIAVVLGTIISVVNASLAAAIVDSTANVELNMRDGVATAVSWDNWCKSNLLSLGSAPNFTNNLRTIINYTGTYSEGAAYRQESWVSSSARGNTSTPITVPAGTTSLPLRINTVTFLCRPMVQPDLSSGCTNRSVTAGMIATSEPWVSSVANAEEAAPNPIGSSCQRPAKVFDYNQLLGVSIIYNTAGGAGSTTNFVGPKYDMVEREEDSRYWFGTPVPFTFTSPTALTAGSIGFRVSYKTIGGFHSLNLANQTQVCMTGPAGVNSSGSVLPWSSCNIATNDYWISVVVQSYGLEPTTTINTALVVKPGASVSLTPTVTKSGNMTTGFQKADNTPGTNWQLSKFIYPPSSTLMPPGVLSKNTAACATPDYASFTSCAVLANYDKADGYFAIAKAYAEAAADVVPSLPPGTRICYVTSVGKSSISSATAWKHAPMRCIVIAGSPAMAIVGGDAWAGGAIAGTAAPQQISGFLGSDTFSSGFGSFGEYGLLATGLIDKYASAGRMDTIAQPYLMFANPSSIPLRTAGSFTTTHTITNHQTALATRGLAGSTNLASFGSTSKDYYATSDVTLPAAALGTGKRILVYAPGRTVTISGNITTSPAVGSFANASLLTIVAGTIAINANVSQVDALLFATNTIATCREAGLNTAAVNANKALLMAGGACRTQRLLVNGAAVGGGVIVTRTAGGIDSTEAPAEQFRLRPEVFLAPYESATSGNLTTDSEVELPPRN